MNLKIKLSGLKSRLDKLYFFNEAHIQQRSLSWPKWSLKISLSHSTRTTFEMPHKFQKKFKKSEIFTTSPYATLASTLKISAQNLDFWPLFWSVKDCWYGILTFWKPSCACELGSLIAWHLVGKKGVKADFWEWGGLGIDSSWWGLIPWCVGGEAMRLWIEGEGGL
jgi:hypothetical protein